MTNIFHRLLDKLVSGKRLSKSEISQLDRLLNDLSCQNELNQYFERGWQESAPVPVDLSFDKIWSQANPEKRGKVQRLWPFFYKVAAILFIPLLTAFFYYYLTPSESTELLALVTDRGEQTNVILPDGSKVWLNVDTRLSYPINYGVASRAIELEGEAYFEVEKNDGLPFEITAGNVTSRVIGTRFVVSAYPSSPIVKTSLLEGSLQVKYKENQTLLQPGEQMLMTKNHEGFVVVAFNEEYELGWKENQLVFRLTPFDQVIDRLEKWYDLEIEYTPTQFASDSITVRFDRHETLENVLKVISRATASHYMVSDKSVIIKKQ